MRIGAKEKFRHVVITLNLSEKEQVTINTTVGKLVEILTENVYSRLRGDINRITNLLDSILLDETLAISILSNGCFEKVNGLEKIVQGIKERLQKRILLEENKKIHDSAVS